MDFVAPVEELAVTGRPLVMAEDKVLDEVESVPIVSEVLIISASALVGCVAKPAKPAKPELVPEGAGLPIGIEE